MGHQHHGAALATSQLMTAVWHFPDCFKVSLKGSVSCSVFEPQSSRRWTQRRGTCRLCLLILLNVAASLPPVPFPLCGWGMVGTEHSRLTTGCVSTVNVEISGNMTKLFFRNKKRWLSPQVSLSKGQVVEMKYYKCAMEKRNKLAIDTNVFQATCDQFWDPGHIDL